MFIWPKIERTAGDSLGDPQDLRDLQDWRPEGDAHRLRFLHGARHFRCTAAAVRCCERRMNSFLSWIQQVCSIFSTIFKALYFLFFFGERVNLIGGLFLMFRATVNDQQDEQGDEFNHGNDTETHP